MMAELLAVDTIIGTLTGENGPYRFFPGAICNGDGIEGRAAGLVFCVYSSSEIRADGLPGGVCETAGKGDEVRLRGGKGHASRLWRAARQGQAAPVPL